MGTQRVAQTVKNLPAMQEIWVCSLGREDSLEKGMTTHFSIPAWRIPWTEEPGRLQSMGSRKVGYEWVTITFTFEAWLAQQTIGRSCWHQGTGAHQNDLHASFICTLTVMFLTVDSNPVQCKNQCCWRPRFNICKPLGM